MSSAVGSPPGTPFKNRSLHENAMLRTPLPGGRNGGQPERQTTPQQNAASDDDHTPEKLGQASDEIQVPYTPSLPEFVPEVPASQSTDDGNIEEGEKDVDDVSSENMNDPLPPFDWDDIRSQYTKAVHEVISEEEDLVDQFAKYTRLFVSWAETSAERDNDKASKRLRTCERHVKLQEQSLEEKKQHYASVVDAFQKALDLLGR